MSAPDCKQYRECGAAAVCWTCRCCEEHCTCDPEATDPEAYDADQQDADRYFDSLPG